MIRKKLIISTVVALLGTTMLSVPTLAETIDFDVTYSYDTYSYKASKADAEQKFYVTGTYFSSSRYALYCRSIKADNAVLSSEKVTIYTGKERASGKYDHRAKAGQLYRLNTWAKLEGFNVRGRYTP